MQVVSTYAQAQSYGKKSRQTDAPQQEGAPQRKEPIMGMEQFISTLE